MEDPKTLFVDNHGFKTLINQTVDLTISPVSDIPKDEGLAVYVFDILFHHFPDESWTEQLLVLRPEIKDTLLPLLEDNNNRHEIYLFSHKLTHLIYAPELCVVRFHRCPPPIMDADRSVF